ncbi:Nn.00g043130.m01.CDS01 [Neocucurbitaria sp. VM-36]
MSASTTPGPTKKIPRRSPNRSSHSTPSAALDAVGTRPRRAQRRPTKQASYELANHAKAYLEGGQFASGYDFLHSLLAAGTSISTPAQPYIGFLAPPAYIALASSLIVYPHITTQAQSKYTIKGSDAALRYLQCVNSTIDSPAYPAIRKAFAFSEERNRRRAPGYRSAAASQSPEPSGDIERIAGVAANAQSLWYRAEDFWHIVGWAFNCSVAHRRRWDRWKLWLSTSLDFLEADWDSCIKQSTGNKTSRESILQESLLWHYIVSDAESTNRGIRRRIVKAILAMATPESQKEYPEVWENEAAELKRRKDIDQLLGEVDFETGELGDYDSDEEMQDVPAQASDEEATTSPSVGSDKGIQNVHDAVEQLGGQDAIRLRQRLIALLAQVAQALPAQFTTPSDFFDNVLEDFIQLPTIVFKVLLSTLAMPGPLQIAFNANLLLPLVSGSVPDYFRYEPTQEHFEATLLPLKGTTQSFAANAKISLILEQMVMYMMTQNALTPTESLRQAMETGIAARHSVYGTGRGKRGNAEEEEQAQGLMEATSDRLLGLLEVLEISTGKAPQPWTNKGKTGSIPTFPSFGSGSSLSPAPDSDTEVDDCV